MMQSGFDVLQEQLQGSVGCRKAERERFYSRKQSQAETLHFVSTLAQTITFCPYSVFVLVMGARGQHSLGIAHGPGPGWHHSPNTHQITALFLEWQLVSVWLFGRIT